MRLVAAAGGALVLYAAAVATLSVAASAPAWPAEHVSKAKVLDAVVAWVARCALSRSARPANCPQRGSDGRSVRSTEYRWRAARPSVLDASVRWRDSVGAFEVRGTANLDVEHDQVLGDGRTVRFAGNFMMLFVAIARSTGDHRDFGAYRWTDPAPTLGFAIRYMGPWWAWQCCATAKEVAIP
jgi:hypothetical protein